MPWPAKYMTAVSAPRAMATKSRMARLNSTTPRSWRASTMSKPALRNNWAIAWASLRVLGGVATSGSALLPMTSATRRCASAGSAGSAASNAPEMAAATQRRNLLIRVLLSNSPSLIIPPTPPMRRPRLAAARRDRDLDRPRHHGRIMRHVVVVPYQQLQRVGSERQRDLRLGLSGAEMQMI